MAKVSFDRFSQDVANIDISDEELQKYFREQDLPPEELHESDGYAPFVVIDPDTVNLEDEDDSRVEGGVAFGFVNGLARTRRRVKFARAVRKDETKDRPIIVSEGDSWFQFPFLLKDVIDHLADDFSVFSAGAAGARLDDMIFKRPEYIEAILTAQEIAEREPDAFLFSAGGNDILGKDGGQRVLETIVRNHQPGETVSLDSAYDETLLQKKFTFIENGYRQLIRDIRSLKPDLPLFFHSYDRVWPLTEDEKSQGGRTARWVTPALNAQGVTRFEDQRLITDDLIGRFRTLLQTIAGAHDENVRYIDTGQPLAEHLDLWHDEIHPTSEGYRRVADHFMAAIKDHLPA